MMDFKDMARDAKLGLKRDILNAEKNAFIKLYFEEVDEAINRLRKSVGDKTTGTLDELRLLQGQIKGRELQRDRYEAMAKEILKSLEDN